MKSNLLRSLTAAFCIAVLANFCYQLIAQHEWFIAAERSYLQAVVLFIFYLIYT